MKKLLCILLLVMLKFTLQAQKLYVIDSNSTSVYAKVEVVNLDGAKKTNGFTVNGIFILPAPGIYKIKVHAIGFEDFASNVSVVKDQTLQINLKHTSITIEDIVVTAQIGNKSPKNSVIPVKVIDGKKIALMGAQNLRDVLTNETGIRISQDNILGSSITMQGISGENVKILIDGVPVIGRQNGNIDLSQIDMSNVERIEIIEGPMSVNYGTNALGGVINIITKKGSTSQRSMGLKTYYESIGTYNCGLTANTYIKNLTVQVTGARNFFDGWSANDRYEALPQKHLADTNRVKTWKPKEQYTAGINLGYQIKHWNLQYKSNYFDEFILNRGKPRAPYFEDAFDDTYKTKRFDNVFSASYAKNPKTYFNTQMAYNYYKRTKNSYYNNLTSLEQQITANNEDQDTTKYKLLNLRSSYVSYFRKLNYEMGGDINIESTTGQRIQQHLQSIGDYAVFTIGEYNITDKFTLRGGLRAAYNSKYNALLLPSFNGKWFINTKNIIRFSYAQGFKAPGLKELYFYFVDFNHNIIGNPELKAEKSNSFNLQYNYVTMLKDALFKVELKAFYNSITNMITLAQIQGLSYTYANIGVYKTEGIQLSSDMALRNFKLNIGVNYTGRYNELSATQPVTKFSFSPEINSSLGYNWAKYKTQFTLYYKYSGKLPYYFMDSNKNLILQEVGSYHWADASITKSFAGNLSVGAGIKNIFNVQNIATANGVGVHQTDSKMAIGAGRFYFFSLNYLLRK